MHTGSVWLVSKFSFKTVLPIKLWLKIESRGEKVRGPPTTDSNIDSKISSKRLESFF